MNCKNCGSKLTNGSFCIRCGTENNEQIVNNPEQIVIKNKKELGGKRVLKAFIKWIIFVVIIGIVIFIMNNVFDSCVAVKGHKECGLGTLCDHECMPPFYFTMHFIFAFSLVGTFLAAPIIFVIYFYKEYKKKKSNDIEN